MHLNAGQKEFNKSVKKRHSVLPCYYFISLYTMFAFFDSSFSNLVIIISPLRRKRSVNQSFLLTPCLYGNERYGRPLLEAWLLPDLSTGETTPLTLSQTRPGFYVSAVQVF